MRLVAMMIVRNEADRYLPVVLDHLQQFCDEIRVLDDNSTDETAGILEGHERVVHRRLIRGSFYDHEGRARQELLQFTVEGRPDYILAIDADELVSDGHGIRERLQEDNTKLVWRLNMQEVWKAEHERLLIRQDGGWREHGVPILFAVPPRRDTRHWRIPDRALASGRTPIYAARRQGTARDFNIDILHFGWAHESAREARYQRYVTHDGGRFHQSTHLDSIMWTDERVRLTERPWPTALLPYRDALIR